MGGGGGGKTFFFFLEKKGLTGGAGGNKKKRDFWGSRTKKKNTKSFKMEEPHSKPPAPLPDRLALFCFEKKKTQTTSINICEVN